MFRKLRPFMLLAFLTLSQAVAADFLVDGVPLPSDANIAETMPGSAYQQWSGVWVGAWSGSLKHILLVESVTEDGLAQVVYATGDDPRAGVQPPRWLRLEGIAAGRTLKVMGTDFSATYEMAEDGNLKALFERGDSIRSAAMAKADLASLSKPDAIVTWTRGKSELLQTELIEFGKLVRLEVVIFRPPGAGPFPLAVINHGSTGRGFNPGMFAQTWFSADLADFLNARGWLVAFLQRRGRGKSEGL